MLPASSLKEGKTEVKDVKTNVEEVMSAMRDVEIDVPQVRVPTMEEVRPLTFEAKEIIQELTPQTNLPAESLKGKPVNNFSP